MTLLSLKPQFSRGEDAYKVEFSDGSSIIFSSSYLNPENPIENAIKTADLDALTEKELSIEEEEAFRFAAECLRAERSALRLVARAEQNSLGLTAKLRRRHGMDAVKAVVSRFMEKNLLDDSRYAERWIRSRLALRKAVSPQRLLAGLRSRGIDRDSARKTLDRVLDPDTEYTLLLQFLDKNPNRNEGPLLKSQLKYEGFSYEALDRYFSGD